MNLNELEHKIFEIKTQTEFKQIALQVFNHQYQHNEIYNKFCNFLGEIPESVKEIQDIPFIPISFFKSQTVKTGSFIEQKIFTSSGTSGTETSKHYVKSLKLYETSFLKAFDVYYPDWKSSVIIGLLPSYLEREGSSLIYMVDNLINHSDNKNSKFELELTSEFINYLETSPEPKILFGVTFALIEMANKEVKPRNTIIIETGGMKGRGKELTRDELHELIQTNIQPKAIHSEYGMTELMSQSYLQNKNFECPNWIKFLVRETTDPLNIMLSGKGVLNVIDLANLYSCSFIATDDLGKVHTNGSFEVLGRIDHTQMRGCNLLIL